MIGRQVIKTNRAFTLEELREFLDQNWDQEEYNSYIIGKPTPASIEEYLLLPATERFMVILYSRKKGSFFSKDDKVILSVCDTPSGIGDRLLAGIPSKNLFFGIWKVSKTMSVEKERKGPAEDVLKRYAQYMYSLLEKSGYLK